METLIINEKFKDIPEYIISELKSILNNKECYKLLEKQLNSTSIVIEKDNYQVTIKSIEDLIEILDMLNCYETVS